MLGTAYFSVSNDEAARKNFARAYELKDGRLTQEENFQTTALYHSYITGNLEKETTVLLLYQQAYPRSAFAANRLGIAYSTIGRKDEALKQFYRAIELVLRCLPLSTTRMPARRSCSWTAYPTPRNYSGGGSRKAR